MPNRKTIAVSGYFDPLHTGHIEYFQKAKKLGGDLVVIVNTDKQAMIKKGYVFMPEDERINIISNLKMVDSVILSVDDDLTVCKTLEMIKPDTFAKGGDRFDWNIPETKVCRELGIKIVHGLGEKVQSSSWLLEKIKGLIFKIEDSR